MLEVSISSRSNKRRLSSDPLRELEMNRLRKDSDGILGLEFSSKSGSKRIKTLVQSAESVIEASTKLREEVLLSNVLKGTSGLVCKSEVETVVVQADVGFCEARIAEESKCEIVIIEDSYSEEPPHVVEAGEEIQSSVGLPTQAVELSLGSSGLCLNQLEDVEPSKSHVSLRELLGRVEELEELFLATFTGDILWFLSEFSIPKGLPVTVAYHDYEKCWSSAIVDRLESPYPEWPNVSLVYPPFPTLRRTTDKGKMHGIGCHHPKFFLLKRKDSLRVIITSANLSSRQWQHVSNTVWWQDFPKKSYNYKSLFCSSRTLEGDFAVQLAAFVATMVKDVPSQVHWPVDLAGYDFLEASVSLVTSVPGLHKPLWQTPPPEVEKESYLGTVSANVVGISYWFHTKADPNGIKLRKLASLLSRITPNSDGMIDIVLRRNRMVTADPNAVSVFVASKPSKLPDEFEEEGVQLGFLPRNTAKWVAPLLDRGICSFLGRIWSRQVLPVASGKSKDVVQLALFVIEGPRFSSLPDSPLASEIILPLTTLLASVQRHYGLWRLEEILSAYKWPDCSETDFSYYASSIGTSLNASFLASFSGAAGKKAISDDDSYESDPEWGRWTAQHEQAKPSMKVLFPTLERVRVAKQGPASHRGVLCFSEKTWDRLKSTGILHDAVPFPDSRIGVPMHAKVARRRFWCSSSKKAFGWVYSGSHNFSPAAWGRCIRRINDSQKNSRLHICNYELGMVFIDPPTTYLDDGDSRQCRHKGWTGIDDFPLPFMVPAPEYRPSDRPATQTAIYKLVQELGQEPAVASEVADEVADLDTELISEIELESQDDATSSAAYVEALWDETTSDACSDKTKTMINTTAERNRRA